MPKSVDRMKVKIAEERVKSGQPPASRRCCKGYLGVHTADCPKWGKKAKVIAWISDLPKGMETCCPSGMHTKDCLKGTGLTDAK